MAIGIGAAVTLEDRVLTGDDGRCAAEIGEAVRRPADSSGAAVPIAYVYANGDVQLARVHHIVSGLAGAEVRLVVQQLEEVARRSRTPIPRSLDGLLPEGTSAANREEQLKQALQHAFGSCTAIGRALQNPPGRDQREFMRYAVTGGLTECNCRGADLEAIEYLLVPPQIEPLFWVPLPTSGSAGASVTGAALGSR
ncbi:MAG: hypothetical protein HY996_05070 [Micrococcales bacterium]|nr:hypothetical protein [Micrococcales bacterium]